jgi:hypothetical protein
MEIEKNKNMRPNDLKRTSMEAWRIMTFYEKFEQIVALILTFIISVVIIASLFKLTENVFLLIFKSVDSIQQHSLQRNYSVPNAKKPRNYSDPLLIFTLFCGFRKNYQ